MLKITQCKLDDLTQEEQELQPNNGSGKEFAGYLVVERNGKRTIYSDAMEPEDCMFVRDLSWILPLVEAAYKFGLDDAPAQVASAKESSRA